VGNVVHNFNTTGSNGIKTAGGAALSFVYSNTLYNNATGWLSAAYQKTRLINNLSYSNTTGFGGGAEPGSDYNLDGPSGSTAPGANSKNAATVTFVDSANLDLHLATGDAGAKDSGTDLSADANYPFAFDIDGTTRAGTWDIGADEYVAAGGDTALAGIIQARASIVAVLATGISFLGAALGTGSVQAVLTTDIPIASTAIARATASADLTTAIPFASTQAGRAIVVADLGTAIPLSSSATARATVTASLEAKAADLASIAQGRAIVTAALSTSLALSASATASATMTAVLGDYSALGIPSTHNGVRISPNHNGVRVSPNHNGVRISPNHNGVRIIDG
jgi:hypothetical protein